MDQQQLMVQMALTAWNQQLKRMTDTFNSLSDEQLMQEVAPGKNRAIYLLGHMAAVHDRMAPLLGIGERQFPELDPIFISSPDKAVATLPDTATLRNAWAQANEALTNQLGSLSAEGWFQRHTQMTDEDFAKDPARNRLSVLMSRTSHIASHQGQLALIKK
jgi:hypothetical protein